MNVEIPRLEHQIEIDAPPAKVWELISDVRRMNEWSPQVTSTRLRAGYDTVALGTEFTNRNQHQGQEWTTHATIVRFEPEQALAFRVAENGMVWAYELTPLGDSGTLLTQRREAPEGVSELAAGFVESHLGGAGTLMPAVAAGGRETLEALKAAAEAP